VVAGTVLEDGTRKQYKCNGLLLYLVTVGVFVGLGITGIIDAAWPAAHALELFVAMNVLELAFAVFLYVRGVRSTATSASLRRHSHGSALLDFVIGVQLNPELLGIDLKFFAYRPAMIGWALLSLSNAFRQAAILGGVGCRISLAMGLYQAFALWYISDYFWHEPYMLSTWDIVAERFGLMLSWGDYVFIVFVFGLQSFALVTKGAAYDASVGLAAVCVAMYAAGYYIFRASNAQKARFKQDPQHALICGKPPVLVGGKLLASGWWSVARHANYLGDLLMAWAMALPCGLACPVWAYAYPVYLTILLIHRERRDERRCAAKYGKAWELYTKQVPHRIIPFLY
jgi:delta14-sterol reductase